MGLLQRNAVERSCHKERTEANTMRRYFVLAWVVVLWLLPVQQANAFNAATARGCDFNGDGYSDQGLTARFEDFPIAGGTAVDAGAVNVIYGSAAPGSNVDDDFLRQGASGIDGTAESGDQFGAGLACGNFNADAYDDLAIGVPGEDPGGVIHVLLGASGGLLPAVDETWSQNTGIVGTALAGDDFGAALTTGDYNGDGYDDLAVGAPRDDEGGASDAGVVNVVPGSVESGSILTAVGNEMWSQATSGTDDAAQSFDRFGASLASGYFNADTYEDLAVGVPGEDIDTPSGLVANAGGVHFLPGAPGYLTSAGDQLLYQGAKGVPGVAESQDSFGYALAAGDFNGTGTDDLAVGVPNQMVSAHAGAGQIVVLLQISQNPISGSKTMSQDSAAVEEHAARNDHFGRALATGDFNQDPYDDLAVGVQYENVGTIRDAGGVNVLPGHLTGVLSAATDSYWSQNQGGIEDTSEVQDYFGSAVAAADLDGDGFDDLIVGVPQENNGAIPDSCLANNIFGTSTGLLADEDVRWIQGVNGIADQAESADCVEEIP